MQSVISAFYIYITFLQSKELPVHLLQESTSNLYKTILAHFIKPHIIAQSDDILSIDIECSTNYKESSSAHIGYCTKQYTQTKDLVETLNIISFSRKFTSFKLKLAVIC